MHALSKSMTLLVTVKINEGLSNGPNGTLSQDKSSMLLKSMQSSAKLHYTVKIN